MFIFLINSVNLSLSHNNTLFFSANSIALLVNVLFVSTTATWQLFIDLLPIFGAGFILIPWSISLFISKEITYGFWILALYLIVTIIKQLLEPKLISNGIGIHPIFTIIAMYTGFKYLGVMGMFVGPIILIILKNIFANFLDNGIVKSLLDFYKK